MDCQGERNTAEKRKKSPMEEERDEELAAQLARIERELKRKERKLKKYNKVLKAKKHVKDTVKQQSAIGAHKTDSPAQNTSRAPKSCSSRSVTFSTKSPEVKYVSTHHEEPSGGNLANLRPHASTQGSDESVKSTQKKVISNSGLASDFPHVQDRCEGEAGLQSHDRTSLSVHVVTTQSEAEHSLEDREGAGNVLCQREGNEIEMMPSESWTEGAQGISDGTEYLDCGQDTTTSMYYHSHSLTDSVSHIQQSGPTHSDSRDDPGNVKDHLSASPSMDITKEDYELCMLPEWSPQPPPRDTEPVTTKEGCVTPTQPKNSGTPDAIPPGDDKLFSPDLFTTQVETEVKRSCISQRQRWMKRTSQSSTESPESSSNSRKDITEKLMLGRLRKGGSDFQVLGELKGTLKEECEVRSQNITEIEGRIGMEINCMAESQQDKVRRKCEDLATEKDINPNAACKNENYSKNTNRNIPFVVEEVEEDGNGSGRIKTIKAQVREMEKANIRNVGSADSQPSCGQTPKRETDLKGTCRISLDRGTSWQKIEKIKVATSFCSSPHTSDSHSRHHISSDPHSSSHASSDPHSNPHVSSDPHSRPHASSYPLPTPLISSDPNSKPHSSSDPHSRLHTSLDSHSNPLSSSDPHSRPHISSNPHSRPHASSDPHSRPHITPQDRKANSGVSKNIPSIFHRNFTDNTHGKDSLHDLNDGKVQRANCISNDICLGSGETPLLTTTTTNYTTTTTGLLEEHVKAEVRSWMPPVSNDYGSCLITSLTTSEHTCILLTVHEFGVKVWRAPSSEGEEWVVIGETRHRIGSATEVRSASVVGLPSGEEARFLLVVQRQNMEEIEVLYVQLGLHSGDLLITAASLKSPHNVQHLTTCALGEWSIASYWEPPEPPPNKGTLTLLELDVAYSRRGKKWELICQSSTCSLPVSGEEWPFCVTSLDEDCGPSGLLICWSGSTTTLYDPWQSSIVGCIPWTVKGPVWALATEDLMFVVSQEPGTPHVTLNALNPLSGICDTFFTLDLSKEAGALAACPGRGDGPGRVSGVSLCPDGFTLCCAGGQITCINFRVRSRDREVTTGT